jgi:hypothetical protein
MLSISDKSTSNVVHLTDTDIESSYPISIALGILVDFHGYAWKPLDAHTERLMTSPVVRSALKYEMKSVIAAIEAYLSRSVAQYPPEGGEHIIPAAVLGE